MVAGKAFETLWIKGYIVGWVTGYLKGANVREKYYKKAIESSLQETDWWIGELYASQKMKINWLTEVSNTQSQDLYLYNEGQIDGLEDGLEVGKQFNAFLLDSIMPSREGICLAKLHTTFRTGNSQVVLELKNEAQNGDLGAQELLNELALK